MMTYLVNRVVLEIILTKLIKYHQRILHRNILTIKSAAAKDVTYMYVVPFNFLSMVVTTMISLFAMHVVKIRMTNGAMTQNFSCFFLALSRICEIIIVLFILA